MTFSIIIAAYNVATYISKSIDSCINQIGMSIDDYEIIVIDDGSTDATGLIIDSYQSQSNVKIIHQQNIGLSATRNKGIELASGDYILFLDGDDWFLSSTLKEIKQHILKNNAIDLIVFPMTYWFSDEKFYVKSFGLCENKIYDSYSFLKDTIGKKLLNIIPAPCKCYNRKHLITKKQKFIEGILHEDNPFFAETVKNFHYITYIDKGYYVYRQKREGSITNSQTLKNFNGVVIGNAHILNLWGCRNKYINYMISSINVFQVILDYPTVEEVNTVAAYYRSFNQKWIACKQIINFPFFPKAIIRHLLFLVDPKLLSKFMNSYYNKK